MKKLALSLLLPLLVCLVACSPLEQQARNTAAALQGAIVAAQGQYHDTCTSNPKQNSCGIINNAISGENALITAVETYCGWSATNPPADPNATCVPVKTAQAGLQAAIANATTFITELKGVIH
jgi:hypothetical protein